MQYTDIQIYSPAFCATPIILTPVPLSCWPPLWIKTSKIFLKRGAFSARIMAFGSIFFLSTVSQIYLLMVIRIKVIFYPPVGAGLLRKKL
ncbi:hypothetical protein KCP74_22145 [Salmonella enterica subsp. enterica]|nr:hypothetical protein KCP74_22145 [Salmonella enterica subsp. enterica]